MGSTGVARWARPSARAEAGFCLGSVRVFSKNGRIYRRRPKRGCLANTILEIVLTTLCVKVYPRYVQYVARSVAMLCISSL